jgi:hypothetical protein
MAGDRLKVDDVVRVYTAPFAGQRARVAYLSPDGRTATVALLEPVTSRKRTLYQPGESARVPADKCRGRRRCRRDRPQTARDVRRRPHAHPVRRGARRMIVTLSLHTPTDYALFLKIKALPAYRFTGRTAWFPDEYADRIGVKAPERTGGNCDPLAGLFDYQRDVSRLAFRKERFAVFAECGLGKTLIGSEFVRHALGVLPERKAVLWVSPSMVVRQTVRELERFYGSDLAPEVVKAADLPGWLAGGGRFGITNYEAIREGLGASRLGGIIADESSIMKSHYGAYGTRLIEMGRGVRFKLCLTGTPAPNDRIEYANHAVFLDRFPTVNSFLARFFVNRGMTGERWELKPHALRPFYRALSDWCIFLSDPAVFGWKDNTDTIPPMSVEVLDVDMTDGQRAAVQAETGDLFGHPGGITSRAKLARIAKGIGDGPATGTHKPEFIRRLVESWPGESTIVWCRFNREQEGMAALFPGCANISGDTPDDERERLIDDFKAGRRRVIVSKSKLLGFGLNLQIATRMIFSTCQDSYEEFWQCVKRANRVGSLRPLRVYIPVTDVERPMVDNVLRKARMVDADTRAQQSLFRDVTHGQNAGGEPGVYEGVLSRQPASLEADGGARSQAQRRPAG